MENKKPNSKKTNEVVVRPEVAAGLPGATSKVHRILSRAGIDPDRLSILHLGRPPILLKYETPRWARRMVVAYLLWFVLFLLEHNGVELPIYVDAILSLVVGLMIIQVACQVLVSTTDAKKQFTFDPFFIGTRNFGGFSRW